MFSPIGTDFQSSGLIFGYKCDVNNHVTNPTISATMLFEAFHGVKSRTNCDSRNRVGKLIPCEIS